MKLKTLILTLLLASTACAQDQHSQSKDIVQNMGNDAILRLTDKKLPQKEREKRFKEMFHEKFAIQSIARFVLGRYWKTATPQEQEEYTRVFEDVVSNVYADKFRNYNGEQFEVHTAKNGKGTEILVESTINRPVGEPIAVQWKLQNDPKNNVMLITDVIIEGISMRQTYRDEHASLLEKNGGRIAGLIAALKKRL